MNFNQCQVCAIAHTRGAEKRLWRRQRKKNFSTQQRAIQFELRQTIFPSAAAASLSICQASNFPARSTSKNAPGERGARITSLFLWGQANDKPDRHSRQKLNSPANFSNQPSLQLFSTLRERYIFFSPIAR